MARIDIAYCEDCAAKHNLFRTPQKALKNCYLCGHTRICSMHPYAASHVKRMAAEEQKDNLKRRRSALALAEIKADIKNRHPAGGEGDANAEVAGDVGRDGDVPSGAAEEAAAGSAQAHTA
jgi:hypothetical protein